MPAAPASITARTVAATSSADPSPYPLSTSAVTGTVTARTMRRITPIISSRSSRSPSDFPIVHDTAALVVAIACAPASSITRALAASHALGSTSGLWSCSRRNSAAFSACVISFISGCEFSDHSRPSDGTWQ